MTISKDAAVLPSSTPKVSSLGKQFTSTTLGLEALAAPKANPDLSTLGEAYSNSIQMEEYAMSPLNTPTQNFSLVPLYGDLGELDETYASYKSINSLLGKASTPSLGTATNGMLARSYLSVFNSFRSDFEDFAWSRNYLSANLSSPVASLASETGSLVEVSSNLVGSVDDVDGSTFGSDTRLSNLANLRPTVRNSIVNYNAFQKVFKPRLDEGRAHVQSVSFADLSQKQPFISDSKVPYLQLLGKNRDSFFETPLYYQLPHKSFNPTYALIDSLNTPMYDFPFLLARTSDTARFT